MAERTSVIRERQIELEDIERILLDGDIVFSAVDDNTLTFSLAGNRTFFVVCDINDSRDAITLAFVGLLYVKADDTRVAEICQFLLHLNFNIWLGHFERDASDGEIRFRIEIPLWGQKIEAWAFNRALFSGASTVDESFELVNKLWTGASTLAEAIQQLDETIDSPDTDD